MKLLHRSNTLGRFFPDSLDLFPTDVEAEVGIEVMATRTSSSDNVDVRSMVAEPRRSRVSRMYHTVMFAWLVVL
jgi:hypothetical protein